MIHDMISSLVLLVLRSATAGAPAKEAAEELLRRASSNGASGTTDGASTTGKKPFDGRAFRRSLGKTGRYQRQPRNDPASLALMEEHGVGYRQDSFSHIPQTGFSNHCHTVVAKRRRKGARATGPG